MFRPDVGRSECGTSDAQLQMENKDIQLAAFHRTCHFHTRIFAGYAIAGLGAAAAVVSLIVLTRDPVSSDGRVAGARPRSGLAIAPLIGPDRAGAQLAVTW